MEIKRKPFQGVMNIISFNRHFYLTAAGLIILAAAISSFMPYVLQILFLISATAAAFSIVVSLMVSYYIYDYSGLYNLAWLPELNKLRVLNINAGFDETTKIISERYPGVILSVCDFYHPERHTEKSLQRARKAYPPAAESVRVSTGQLPFPDNCFDFCLAIFSAHEIRQQDEREGFFKELGRVTSGNGQIIVTEHLRDWKNFMAYTVGFFHFHSRSAWMRTFSQSNLSVIREVRSPPFITTFFLKKNGNTT